MMNRIILLIFICLLVLLPGCNNTQQDSSLDLPTENGEITFSEPRFGIPGSVVLAQSIDLGFSMEGQIVELLVEEGDTVYPGQVIAKLDTTNIEREIDQAEASLAIALANYEKAQVGPHEALIQQAEINVTAVAVRKPNNSPEATAQAIDIALAQTQLEYMLAQPFPEDIAIARAEYDQVNSYLEGIKSKLEQAILVAPVNGTVIELIAHENEYIRIGEPILRLTDFSDLLVEAVADESDLMGFEIGDQAIVQMESLPEIEYNAIVENITPIEDAGDNPNFMVKLKTRDPIDSKYWGMRVEVFLGD